MNPGAMAFNKEYFKQINQKLKDNKFPDLEDGLFNAELLDTDYGPSKNSGRLQASFKWKIDQDEVANAGRIAFDNIGLTDAQGVPSEGGYTAFGIRMRQLGLTNEDAVADDPQGALQAVVGSKARIQLKTDGEFQNVRVKKLLYSPLADNDPQPQAAGNGSAIPPTTVAAPTPTPEPEPTAPDNAAAYDNAPFSNTSTVEVKEGMEVVYRAKDGQKACIVETELEDSDQIMLRPKSGGKAFLAKRTDCFFVVPSETVIAPTPEPEPQPEAEEEAIVLEIGMNVRGKYKDTVITGTVKKIEEQLELVWITSGKMAYPCKLDTLELVS